jgi:perosamine synthetase
VLTAADIDLIVAHIRRLADVDKPGTVPLHEPEFAGNEQAYVGQCVASRDVSATGDFVRRFEAQLAACVGVRHVVATNTGTAALQLALLACGVRDGDEVLVPALSFVAPANAVRYCGATPHFVDVEARTLGVDPWKLREYLAYETERRGDTCVNRRTGRPIRALVPVHVFGHPVDLDPLLELAADHAVTVVEDAAQALGSCYKGRAAGTLGRAGILSFNGNKIVTAGGGGALLTDDEALADAARHLANVAKTAHPWTIVHDRVGYNFRMPNINAALGCAQLEQLPDFVARKRRLAEAYQEAFRSVPCLRVVREPPFGRSNYWLNAVVITDAASRDALLRRTHAAGILTRAAWRPLHRLPAFAAAPAMDLAATDDLADRLINLPSSARLMPAACPVTATRSGSPP